MSDRFDPARGDLEVGEGVPGEARVGGVRIVHESWGTGPPLVCCHPFAVDRSIWWPQRARFAERYRVITFDQRGSGESDHPVPAAGEEDPYTIDSFAEDLRGVLDDLGIQSARVLGYSMGGATALRFATRWPERVEALVLASTMASRLPEEIIERAGAVKQVLSREGLRGAYRFYFGGSLFKGAPRESWVEAVLEAWAARATPHGFSGCYRVTIDRPSMVAELHRIQAPTLILVGERDALYLEEADLMAQRIPSARKVVVKGAGHAMNVEAPELFADEVMRFLAAAPRGSSGQLGQPSG